MNETAWREQVPKFVRILQIIVTALVIGCVVFLGVVLVVRAAGSARGDHEDAWVFTAMAFVFLGTVIVARCVVPGAIVRGGRKKIAGGTFQLPQARQASQQRSLQTLEQMGDAGKLLVLYQIKTIVAAALIEGATFLFLVMALVMPRGAVLLGTALVLILVIAGHMPTRAGVTRWIEDQLRLLEEERSLGR
jgi:hypothetical protein